MKLFGLELFKRKALAPVDTRGSGVWGWLGDVFPGSWQQNITINRDGVLANTTVFACATLIASDIAKLRWRIIKPDKEDPDIWVEDRSPAFNNLLKQPNQYQNHIQFKENWILSKLSRGNTYVLKERDSRNVVKKLYILDPCRVSVLVSDDGQVFYRLNCDNLAGLPSEGVMVPASEIIHDRFNCLFHPLVGLSPIFACGLAATHAQNIQEQYTRFFKNGALPSGILTAEGHINDDTAKRLAAAWQTNYGGENAGKVAVLGDGLKFDRMVMTAVDAEVINQLKFSDEKICSVFHVPAYKVGVGQAPTYNNIGALQQDYYDTCLQSLIESMELCLDQGLALPDDIGLELDLEGLLRMDRAAQIASLGEGVKNSLLAPNEGRKKLGLKRVQGGDSPLAQQQNYSLAALAKRDAQDDPFGKASPAPAPAALSAPLAPAPLDDSGKEADWRLKAFESFELEMQDE